MNLRVFLGFTVLMVLELLLSSSSCCETDKKKKLYFLTDVDLLQNPSVKPHVFSRFAFISQVLLNEFTVEPQQEYEKIGTSFLLKAFGVSVEMRCFFLTGSVLSFLQQAVLKPKETHYGSIRTKSPGLNLPQ